MGQSKSTAPGPILRSVNPLAIEAMNEIGIDISSHRSKSVDEFTQQHFDLVITVCDKAKESCPIFPGAPERIHWSYEDPAAVEGLRRRNWRHSVACAMISGCVSRVSLPLALPVSFASPPYLICLKARTNNELLFVTCISIL